jgi:hypothetical protein
MKKTILFTLLAVVAQNQLFAQLKNYGREGKIKIIADKTTLKITHTQVPIFQAPADQKMQTPLLAVASAVISPAITFIEKTIKEKAKKDALAYNASYKCNASGQGFYNNSGVTDLPKLTLKRRIKTIDGEELTAVDIDFIPEMSSDKTAFRYFVKNKCKYNYSIAKTKRFYDFIDLTFEIKFKSIYVKDAEYKIEDLRITTLSIPMVEVGNTQQLSEEAYSGWIPLPPKSTILTTKGIAPKNDVYDMINKNTGLYEIEITATETNPYKIKAENKQSIIESSGEPAAELLNTFIESMLKKDDE